MDGSSSMTKSIAKATKDWLKNKYIKVMEWSSFSSRPLVLQNSVEGAQALSFQEAANLVTNDKKRLTTVQMVTSTKYILLGSQILFSLNDLQMKV